MHTHYLLKGIGASIGYILAAVIHNEQILYFISAIIFVICLLSTMTAAKEKPFRIKTKSMQVIDGF